MKGLTTLCAFALTFSAPAFAEWDPTWERPIEEAKMKIQDATGAYHQADAVVLTLHQRDGRRQPTSLSLNYRDVESNEVVKHALPMLSETLDECKSILRVAELVQSGGEKVRIELFDHRNRTCDRRASEWEATVSSSGNGSQVEKSDMKLVGTPEPLLTIATP